MNILSIVSYFMGELSVSFCRWFKIKREQCWLGIFRSIYYSPLFLYFAQQVSIKHFWIHTLIFYQIDFHPSSASCFQPVSSFSEWVGKQWLRLALDGVTEHFRLFVLLFCFLSSSCSQGRVVTWSVRPGRNLDATLYFASCCCQGDLVCKCSIP